MDVPPPSSSSTAKQVESRQQNPRDDSQHAGSEADRVRRVAQIAAQTLPSSSALSSSSSPLSSVPPVAPPAAKSKGWPKLSVHVEQPSGSGEQIIPLSTPSGPLPQLSFLAQSAASIRNWSREQLNVIPAQALELPDTQGWLESFRSTVQALVSSTNTSSALVLLPQSTHATGGTGTSGSYFVCNPAGEKIAVFKPDDEELGTKNCPNSEMRTADAGRARDGINPGDSAALECVAFLLDRQRLIPPTVMVTLPCFRTFGCYFPAATKTGSLQQFVPNTRTFGDLQPEERDRMWKNSELIRQISDIALLDIRLFNTDRNKGNLLITAERLVPIDHGCIAAIGFVDDVNLCWLVIPEVFNKKLNLSEISKLDLNWDRDKNLVLATFPNLHPAYLRTLEASHVLLEIGLQRGLTIGQIASFLLPGSRVERCVMFYLFKRANATSNFSLTIREEVAKTMDFLNELERKTGSTSSLSTAAAERDPQDRTDPAVASIRRHLLDESIL